MYISFFEIYNEKIYDLLEWNSKKLKREHLEIREEKDGYFSIVELKKIQVQRKEEAYHYLEKGLVKRATSQTSLNSNSSRSHSIFQIYLEKETSEGIIIRSKLRIVDLAGSEKYSLRKDLPP